MAHLGDDVAAFVDVQLSPRAMEAAHRHLAHCRICAEAVRAQQQLKATMRASAWQGVPQSLYEALSKLPENDVSDDGPLLRQQRGVGPALSAVLVLTGTSLAFLMLAYVMGAPSDDSDPVRPEIDAWAAAFAPANESEFHTVNVRRSTNFISSAMMADLDRQGWSCHETLGDGFHRTDGEWHDRQTVAVSYTDGTSEVRLYEQGGRLDEAVTTGFQRESWNDHDVWVRSGQPLVVMWDADGMVYTIVSNAPRRQLARVVSDLPATPPHKSVIERVSDGVTRIARLI